MFSDGRYLSDGEFVPSGWPTWFDVIGDHDQGFQIGPSLAMKFMTVYRFHPCTDYLVSLMGWHTEDVNNSILPEFSIGGEAFDYKELRSAGVSATKNYVKLGQGYSIDVSFSFEVLK